MKTRALALALQFALLAAVIVWDAAQGPERMPLHWGMAGEADRVGSLERWVLESALLAAGLLLVVGLAVLLVRKGPVSLLNVPHREFWARPENTARARDLLLDDVVDIVGDVVLLVTVIELVALLRARSGNLDFPITWFVGLLVVFFLSVGWRLFKLPGRYSPR